MCGLIYFESEKFCGCVNEVNARAKEDGFNTADLVLSARRQDRQTPSPRGGGGGVG